MPYEENIALVKTTMEALLGGNPEPLLAAITDDAVIEAIIPAGTPISGEFRGREGFLRYLTALGEVRMENRHAPRPYGAYLRYRPFDGVDFDIQAGRIPSTFGAFGRHAYGTDNLVIGYPLAYWLARQPDGRRVDLNLAWYAFERQGAEAVNQGNRQADGERWLRTASGLASLAGPGLPPEVALERLATPDGRGQRLVLWWYWVDGTVTADPLKAKLLQARGRLLGHAPPTAIVALSTMVTEGGVAEAQAAVASLLTAGGLDPSAWLAALTAPGS